MPDKPEIWLECNGQSCAAYPKLVAILGKDTVPDYRGVFLRGHGSQSHTKLNGSLNGSTETIHSSANLGELQGDAIRNITGSSGYYYSGYSGFFVSGTVLPMYQGAISLRNSLSTKVRQVDGDPKPFSSFNVDASLIVPISNENRPINIAVKYLIKAK